VGGSFEASPLEASWFASDDRDAVAFGSEQARTPVMTPSYLSARICCPAQPCFNACPGRPPYRVRRQMAAIVSSAGCSSLFVTIQLRSGFRIL
jgi:hypothetical protein